jgi:hypothetical protein
MYKYGLHALDGLLMVNVGCTSSKIWAFLKFIYDADLCEWSDFCSRVWSMF